MLVPFTGYVLFDRKLSLSRFYHKNGLKEMLEGNYAGIMVNLFRKGYIY